MFTSKLLGNHAKCWEKEMKTCNEQHFAIQRRLLPEICINLVVGTAVHLARMQDFLYMCLIK